MFAYAKRERRSEVSGRSTLRYEAPSVTPYIRRCNTRFLFDFRRFAPFPSFLVRPFGSCVSFCRRGPLGGLDVRVLRVCPAWSSLPRRVLCARLDIGSFVLLRRVHAGPFSPLRPGLEGPAAAVVLPSGLDSAFRASPLVAGILFAHSLPPSRWVLGILLILFFGPVGRSRWSVPLVGPVSRSRWSVPLVGPVGRSRWSVPLIGPVGQAGSSSSSRGGPVQNSKNTISPSWYSPAPQISNFSWGSGRLLISP